MVLIIMDNVISVRMLLKIIQRKGICLITFGINKKGPQIAGLLYYTKTIFYCFTTLMLLACVPEITFTR